MDRDTKRRINANRFLKRFLGGAIKRFFGITLEDVSLNAAPFLVVANHNTDLDPAFVTLSFSEHLTFVASEHALRKGFGSWLLKRYFAPISRMKGSTDAAAALQIIRRLRAGESVCLFAEGNRSFNGVTGPIFPATGKLAKASGASLVTYRIEGGYLTSPRWSHTIRHGRMLGYCVNVYSPEQLKAMSPDEVNAHISEDLAEDAFLRQAEDGVPYRGKALAEGLERALFICPRCGKIGTLHSKGNRFYCDCGMETTYSETGFFAGENAPFQNVRDWDEWQNAALSAFIDGLSETEEAFFDDGVELVTVEQKHRMRPVSCGRLSISKTAVKLAEQTFSIDEFASVSVIGAYRLVFTANGAHYELRRKNGGFCGRKYFLFTQSVKQG